MDAWKGSLLRVQGLPSILQLHLKRFKFDWQNDRMSKVNSKCTFPAELDLSFVCADIQEEEKPFALYALQAVVVHAGEYGSGHYYSYVRPDVCTGDWYRFNDHIVSKVTFAEVIADAYGGRNYVEPPNEAQGQQSLLRRLQSLLLPLKAPFGYGGRTSNAYVLQYVRRSDIHRLYCFDNPQFQSRLANTV